ncbi:MAG: hypothetical protein ABF289_06115 [Clostridiales bacterium]
MEKNKEITLTEVIVLVILFLIMISENMKELIVYLGRICFSLFQ